MTATHGVDFLYTGIEVAIWLAARLPASSVDIVRLPMPTGPGSWWRACADRLASWTRQRGRNGSLYREVAAGRQVSFTHAGVGIRIGPARASFRQRLACWMRAALRSTALWRTCFSGRDFKPLLFLDLQYRGVRIGDLVASHALRVHPHLGGSLQAGLPLRRMLVDALYLVELAHGLHLDASIPNYVIAPEVTYLHAIYDRALARRGAESVSLVSYREKFLVCEDPRDPAFVAPPATAPLDQASVVAYLDGRLRSPQDYLFYMVFGTNKDANSEIRDMEGGRVPLAPEQVVAVVFLHNFDDGQYYFGCDGFDDLYDWTVFSIDRLLANEKVAKVLVKPHPNVDTSAVFADHIALQRLVERYRGAARCTFLDKSTSLIALARSVRMYGITHHGSVAEELTYLGQPVIASAYAPWRLHYPFLEAWRTVGEYGALLDSLSEDSWAAPTPERRQWLFRYVQEYRLNEIHIRHQLSWMRFAELHAGEPVRNTPAERARYTALMEELSIGAEPFRRFMDLLARDAQCVR